MSSGKWGSSVPGEQLPNLLIVGVTKSGTTSLYWYLSQHPDVCASTHKETNFFSPLCYGRPPSGERADYAQFFAHCASQPYRMEASPEYFYGGPGLVDAVQRALPDARVVVAVRDPVDRLWSAYRYKRLQGGIDDDMSFEAFLDHSLELWDAGVDTREEFAMYRALSIGRYIESLRDWFDAFGDSVYVLFFEHLAATPAATTAGLLRWLELDDEPASAFDYGVSQKTIEPRSRLLHHRARRLADLIDAKTGLNQNRALKGFLREMYFKLNARSPERSMAPEIRRRVEDFYAESNAALARELARRGYRELPPWLDRATHDQHRGR